MLVFVVGVVVFVALVAFVDHQHAMPYSITQEEEEDYIIVVLYSKSAMI